MLINILIVSLYVFALPVLICSIEVLDNKGFFNSFKKWFRPVKRKTKKMIHKIICELLD